MILTRNDNKGEVLTPLTPMLFNFSNGVWCFNHSLSRGFGHKKGDCSQVWSWEGSLSLNFVSYSLTLV